MRILTAESMRRVDRSAIEDVGIPSLVLMENAALGLAEAVGELFAGADAVAIFCGPGNNGGDGFALARHLDARGYGVELFLAAGGKEPSGDAGVQLAICRKQGLTITGIEDEADAMEALARAGDADLAVDALFGTGLGRPLEGVFAALAEGLSELGVPVLAVDLPSGLNGSRRDVFGPHVVADATVSFAAPKVAHVFAPAADAVGELVVTDLGIPPFLVDEAEEDEGALHLMTPGELAGLRAAPRPRQPQGRLRPRAGGGRLARQVGRGDHDLPRGGEERRRPGDGGGAGAGARRGRRRLGRVDGGAARLRSAGPHHGRRGRCGPRRRRRQGRGGARPRARPGRRGRRRHPPRGAAPRAAAGPRRRRPQRLRRAPRRARRARTRRPC